MSTKDKGGAADLKAQRAAAITAVEFQTNTASDLLRAMAAATGDANTAKASKEEASILYCQFAADTVRNELEREGGCRDRAVITEGFCKHMDALRSMLAAEGSPLVDVKTEDGKDTRYSWKGHGANVKSIAKGVTEYVDIEVEADQPELIDVHEAESFTDIKKSVQVCRQADEDDEARELREAKEAYREVEAAIRKLVLGQKEAIDVATLTDDLAVWLNDRLIDGEIAEAIEEQEGGESEEREAA